MIRKLAGTHKFLCWMVCNWCGTKVTYDVSGREVMRYHLKSHEDGIGSAPRTADAPAVPDRPAAGPAA